MDKQSWALFAVFMLSAWIAWLIFSAVRQITSAKTQIALQDRFLLRVSSPETLRVFLESPTGSDFLRVLQRDPHNPWQRIISGLQASTMFGVIGVGALIVGAFWRPAAPLLPFAIAAIVIASALAMSTGVSFRLYQRAGLMSAKRE